MIPSETLLAYLAPDRRQAIASGSELAGRSQGAVLWADLSGFTALSERLARKLGVRRGAEEMGSYLNRFYDALIAPVDGCGGSVVAFSGDAITCWFEADDGRRAIVAAQAMQAAMKPFGRLKLSTGGRASLGIKTAVSSGAVWRLRVGDPAIQYLDTLAGAVLQRLAAMGQLAGTGELLVDEQTAGQLQEHLQIKEWRTSAETGVRAAVLQSLDVPVEASGQAAQIPALSDEQARPWLLPAVYARLRSGDGEFLTELRPAVALFMRFAGLDYEGDERVGEKLDGVIRQVQSILVGYEGTLLQLSIGDKGSYVYAAFGAPLAHEDDAVRALAAALELRELPLETVSIGLSSGMMRTGAYGSATRRTYGVLGDEVNLAARLMEAAQAGQVLASEAVWRATRSEFAWERQAALKVKGRRAGVKPAVLEGRVAQETIIHAPSLAMIGRQAELGVVEAKLVLVRAGQGQVVSITGEAGMGKSRLLAEVLWRADGLTVYSGECQSYGTQSSYLVWQSIWRSFFGLEGAETAAEQIERLEQALRGIDPEFVERLPLLGAVLNLSIADNALTMSMDARSRKRSREALLADCLRARAGRAPLAMVLEDVHWIDPLSRDLLELIGRVIKDLPVLLLLAYRPPAQAEAAAFLPALVNLAYATQVRLAELDRAETGQLVAARLAHFRLAGTLAPALMERLLARTQGNPFYIEELLNYLHDKGLDPRLETAWEQADLPDSLQSLILSRIDQLSERQQITLKTASIIGRLFRVAWLYGYYPALGGAAGVSVDLQVLNRLELILQETAEPQLAYLFKHVITQEVAYESLAYATRANLHEQFARYLEQVAGEDVQPYLDLLAYHYERSDNLAKKREYLRRAGEAARAAYANETALSYLGRALVLVSENDFAERYAVLMARQAVYHILGKREPENQDLADLWALAEVLDDNRRRAHVALGRSGYAHSLSDFPGALDAARQSADLAHLAGATDMETRAHWIWARTLWLQGSYAEARTRYEEALALAQKAKDDTWMAASLGGLGSLDMFEGDYESAQARLERALQLDRDLGNRGKEAASLYNLGEIASLRGDFAQAQAYHEQTLHAWRSTGDQQNVERSLSRVGSIILERRGDYAQARLYSEQALRLSQEMSDRVGELGALFGLSFADLVQNNYLAARVQAEQGLLICREIGFKYFEAMCLENLGSVADELGEYAKALEIHQQALSILRELGEPSLTSQILAGLGMVFYHLGQYGTAREYDQEALSIAEGKIKVAQARALASLGHVLRETGDLDGSADSYRRALHLALEMDLQYLVKPAQTGLALIALARDDPAETLTPVDEILSYVEAVAPSSMDEIVWIYLSCYHILAANADPRARATLNTAYRLLQQIAAGIDDETLRASFLQNVRFNRELIQAWESLAAS